MVLSVMQSLKDRSFEEWAGYEHRKLEAGEKVAGEKFLLIQVIEETLQLGIVSIN